MTSNLITSSNTFYIDASKQQNVALEFACQWAGPGTAGSLTNAIFTLAPTVDGSTYDTNNTTAFAVYQMQVAANVRNINSTNLNARGYKGWIVTSIQNTSAAAPLSNSIVKYGTKISAP